MTGSSAPAAAVRTGVAQVERRLVLIAAAFGVLYSLQNIDGVIAGWPSMRGPLGVAVVALVGGSCLIALLAVARRADPRRVLTVAVAAYALGAVLWPLALHGDLPAALQPWLTSMWPVEAVYLCVASRGMAVPLVATAVAAVALLVLLLGPAGLGPVDAAGAVLAMSVICAVLVLLTGALRYRIRHAEESRQHSLDEYARSQRQAATEAERVRTDALVHDSVLTTLLSAAAAGSAAEQDLASRMASNALRVLAHVNRRGEHGPQLPFALVLQHAHRIAPDAFDVFRLDTDQAGAVTLPAEAADALLAAMVEAMDNSVRHAGDADRSLTAVPLGSDGVRVVVVDDGAGFDSVIALAAGGGLHLAVVERMRKADGRADVVSAPSAGTSVTISWGSSVVSGTRPLVDGTVAR